MFRPLYTLLLFYILVGFTETKLFTSTPLIKSSTILSKIVTPAKTVVLAPVVQPKVATTQVKAATTTTTTASKTATPVVQTNAKTTSTTTTSTSTAGSDYKSQMARMIAGLSFTDNPEGKKLQTDLTNHLFAIYNTLNKIGNSTINQILYKDTLKKQVEEFMKILDQIQDLAEAETGATTVVGNNNILVGQGTVVQGNQNKVKGNTSLITGNNNLVAGNTTITTGTSNTVLGNNTFVLGNNNTAAGNNTVVFATNSAVNKNNSLVIANYTIDLNELNSKSKKTTFVSNSGGLRR